jgi:hypothetical protein
VAEDGLVRVGRDREAEPARELHGAHHPDGVFLEADVGVADRANEAGPEVLEAADVVDDREVADVVEEAVDREVPPEGVLAGRSERVLGSLQQLGSGGGFVPRRLLRPPAKRRDLDDLALGEEDVGEPEPPADQAGIAKQAADRLRGRVRADVEVLGRAAEKQVSNAPADQVRLVARAVEAIQDLQRVRIDARAGDRVLGAGPDAWSGLGRGVDALGGNVRFGNGEAGVSNEVRPLSGPIRLRDPILTQAIDRKGVLTSPVRCETIRRLSRTPGEAGCCDLTRRS